MAQIIAFKKDQEDRINNVLQFVVKHLKMRYIQIDLPN